MTAINIIHGRSVAASREKTPLVSPPRDSECIDEWQSLLEQASVQQPSPLFWKAIDALQAQDCSESLRLDALKDLMRRNGLWF